MTKTVKRNVVVSAILAIMLCVSLIAGATSALFTSESKVNIAVTFTSGKVSVLASIDETSVQTKRLNTEYAQGANNMFEVSASSDDNGLTLENLVPGDAIKFNIVVKNKSTVTVQYRTIICCESDNGLFAGLNVNVGDKEGYNGVTFFVSAWAQLAVGVEDAIVPVSIELPKDAGDEYQDKTCTVSCKVEAVQGNAQVKNPEDGVIYIFTANDLMALSNFVAKEDTVIELCSDLDMQNQEVKSIVAWHADLTFIGNNHTISNVRFERNSEYNVGAAGDSMFYTSNSSTLNVSDLKFVNAKTEAGTDGRYSAIVDSYPQGAVTLSNVDVEGSAVVGTKSSGVLFGHMESSVVVENCDVKNSTVTLASCASEPDGSYAGKVVGTIGFGATLTMNDCSIENVTVAGSLHAENVGDVYGRCLGKLVVNGK